MLRRRFDGIVNGDDVISWASAQSKAQVKLIGSQAADADSSSAESATSPVPYKRRRLQGTRQLKAYPALILTPEEKELCQVEINNSLFNTCSTSCLSLISLPAERRDRLARVLPAYQI